MSSHPAIIGRVRTRDPDPGHFGPDFDSRSWHGSAFTDPGPGARLKARTFWTFCGLFTDFSGLDWYLRRYARVCSLKGGTASKIWVKTRKIVGMATLLFKLRSSFLPSRGGGIGGPNSPYGALGSPDKSSRNLFYQINFNPRVCFYGYFFTQLYGPSYIKQILDGAKNSTI